VNFLFWILHTTHKQFIACHTIGGGPIEFQIFGHKIPPPLSRLPSHVRSKGSLHPSIIFSFQKTLEISRHQIRPSTY
jgi:hypothetical protein